jgi:hypothetical protein
MGKSSREEVLSLLRMAARRCEDAANMLAAAQDRIALHSDYELAAIRLKAANAMLSSAVSLVTEILEDIEEGGGNG